MNPEEQRIAIATVCGWTGIDWNGVDQDFVGVRPEYPSYANPAKFPIPGYLNDLNAMHEAENYAGCYRGFNENYIGNLQAVTPEGQWHECATAAQRAEAFLKTLNLWTE